MAASHPQKYKESWVGWLGIKGVEGGEGCHKKIPHSGAGGREGSCKGMSAVTTGQQITFRGRGGGRN